MAGSYRVPAPASPEESQIRPNPRSAHSGREALRQPAPPAMLPAMTKWIALTGGIGSGKSSVGRLLAELGAVVIDADAIVHELQAPGMPMVKALAEEFGEGILDPAGALDRKALGAIVFSDASARAKLGLLVHGPVISEMLRRAQVARDEGAPLAVLDIPLLFEGAKSGRGAASVIPFDGTILVWVPVETQLERTVARDGCTREEAQSRIDAQLPIDEKRAMADHVIDNSGDPASTEKQVRELYAKLAG